MSTPFVTIVMPVYNGGRYLVDAVAGIIEQSYTDWEMICINDGSTDGSGALLDWFAAKDARIHVHHQANGGLVSALNNGIALAKSPLICRMDQDDIALPNRLALQTKHMQDHPECVVVGGAILEIDADNDPLQVSRLPLAHDEILENLLHRKTGHFHPTTMIRRKDLQAVEGYRRQYEWVEDHDLWLRLAGRGQLANMQEVLLCYRQHASSICWQKSELQRTLMNALLTEAYHARALAIPADVLLSEATVRSAAGPGKWARAAAKGGFRHSALKHLAALQRSDSKLSYKIRMNFEVASRLIAGGWRVRFSRPDTPEVPSFRDWHQRLPKDSVVGLASKAA